MKAQVKVFAVWLDLIRGLAALTVFLGHARVILISSIVVAAGRADMAHKSVALGEAENRTGFGHVAVIVFFVLSGYLVGGGAVRALRNNRWSASNYAIARLSRLWTVLIPVLLLGYILDHAGVALAVPGSLYSAPSGQRMVFPDLLDAMKFQNLIANLFFLQSIVARPFGTNSPLWTLSYEFWFYVAFPFLLFALHPSTSLVRRLLCGVMLAAIASFVGSQICIYFLLWLLGVIVEIVPKRLQSKHARPAAIAGSLIFVLVLLLLIKSDLPLLAADAIESICFALLCYPIVHLQQPARPGIVATAAGGLSAMSYTLYLAHAPILVFVSSLLMPVWRPWTVNPIGLAKFGMTTLAVFMLAAGLYWLFERRTPQVRIWMTAMYDKVTAR